MGFGGGLGFGRLGEVGGGKGGCLGTLPTLGLCVSQGSSENQSQPGTYRHSMELYYRNWLTQWWRLGSPTICCRQAGALGKPVV